MKAARELKFYFCQIHQMLVVIPIKQLLGFKGQYFVTANVHCNGKLICIKQQVAFKGHFTLSLEWLLGIGLTVHIYILRCCEQNLNSII